jgi:hypothetical protein
MKISIISALVAMFASVFANAQTVQALPVRRILTTSSLQSTVYSQLVGSTVKGIAAIQVNNTGLMPIELAFGAAGSEVPQVIIGSGQDTGVLPLQGGYATRISAISLNSVADAGELEMNVFYN